MQVKPYRVVHSVENETATRCVDIVVWSDGQFGFQEWRREPEDPGNWWLLSEGGGMRHSSKTDAEAAARASVPWFGALGGPRVQA